jgi:hypothetical protein
MFVFLHHMHLSNEHISQLQILYKEHFEQEISKEVAYIQGVKLLRLVQLTYKPMTQTEFLRIQNELIKIRARINKRTHS